MENYDRQTGFKKGSLNFWVDFAKNSDSIFGNIYNKIIPSIDRAMIDFLGDSVSFDKYRADFSPTIKNGSLVHFKFMVAYYSEDFKDKENDIDPKIIEDDKTTLKSILNKYGIDLEHEESIQFDLQKGFIVIKAIIGV